MGQRHILHSVIVKVVVSKILIFEYSALDVHTVRRLGNRLAII